MNLEVINKGDYLHFKLIGVFDVSATKRVIRLIKDSYNETHIDLALIDFSSLDVLDVSDTDRYYLGKEVALQLSSVVKLASLAPSSVVNHFSETVAINRGANLRIFTELNEAIEWLLS